MIQVSGRYLCVSAQQTGEFSYLRTLDYGFAARCAARARPRRNPLSSFWAMPLVRAAPFQIPQQLNASRSSKRSKTEPRAQPVIRDATLRRGRAIAAHRTAEPTSNAARWARAEEIAKSENPMRILRFPQESITFPHGPETKKL